MARSDSCELAAANPQLKNATEHNARAAEQALRNARSHLLLERPFLGALAMHLSLRAVAPEHCRRIATDARCIFFNPDYVLAAPNSELQFVLAHEALHCALQHFWRRGQRVRATWDAACDYAVNQLLVADGLAAPAGALLDARFAEMSAEQIYPRLNLNLLEPTLDAHWYQGRSWHWGSAGGGDRKRIDGDAFGDAASEREAHAHAHDPIQPTQALDDSLPAQGLKEPSPFNELLVAQETNEPQLAQVANESLLAQRFGDESLLLQRWQQRLVGAYQHASGSGRLSPIWQREFERATRVSLPWRMLLARFVTAHTRHDYSFQRLSRRSDDYLLPSLVQPAAHIVVALDTSGSIASHEIRQFLDEVDALKTQVRAEVTVLACDRVLAPGCPWRFAAWQAIELPEELNGGGSTRFTPVFEWLQHEAASPDCLIYFTDALGEFPPAEPAFPVLWLVLGNASVPWGERIQMV